MENPNPGIVPQQVAPVAPVTPTAPVVAAPAVQPEPALAQETRERTREQFEKLLESNRRLYEANESLRREMEQRRQSQQIWSGVQNTPQTQQPARPTQVNPADFVEVDPQTGESYLNQEKLAAKLAEVNQRASKAEQVIQNYIKTAEEKEIDRQNKEAFAIYPELNPAGEKFNEKFNKQVRGILFDSMYNADEYGGQPLTFKEAADFARSLFPQSAPAQSTQQQQQAQQQGQELKEQATAQAQSQPQPVRVPVQNDPELAQLQMKTRFGDTEALARRIMHTEHIVPRDGS